jgi:hypothetical protein
LAPRSGGLVDPAIMGPAIWWLASAESDGITGRRVVAIDFPDGQVSAGRR